MRRVVITVLCLAAACGGAVALTAPPGAAGRYTLISVDQHTLPVHLDDTSGSPQIVAGSLRLEPNGYFVLSVSDSILVAQGAVRNDWSDGGTWAVDGAILTLSDTASEARDDYGAGSSMYVGSIAPHTIWLTLGASDGDAAHLYRFVQ